MTTATKERRARHRPEPEALGEIRADGSYPLEIFKGKTGLGDYALRQARRKGLVVRRRGGRAFVMGSDWHAYLASQDTADEA